MSGGTSRKPPWWRWYEPPRWFPKRLHLLTCTFCQGISAYVRDQDRQRKAVAQ